MRLFPLLIFASLLFSTAVAEDKKAADTQEPIPFGMLSQNSGCVIFKEFRKTSGMFWGVAVTTKTVVKLEVIETQNYNLTRKLWDETQMDDMNELQRISLKDKIKFVKIPNKKPTSDQLEKARAMCKEPS